MRKPAPPANPEWAPGEREAIDWIKDCPSLAQLDLRVGKLKADKPKVWNYRSVQDAEKAKRFELEAMAETADPV
jgi:hypothetical protein